MIGRSCAPLMLAAAVAMAAAFVPALEADVLLQDFENWPSSTMPTSQTVDGWELTNGFVNASLPSSSGSNAVWLFYGTAGITNSWLTLPPLTNGIGTLKLKARTKSGTTAGYQILTSTNGTVWTVSSSNTQTTTTWSPRTFTLNLYGTNYVRIRHTASASANYLGFDDVETTNPPARVLISDVVTTPAEPYVNDSVGVSGTFAPIGAASNIQATTYYRVGSSGPWTPIGMDAGSGNSFATTSGIPGVGVGILVQYYVNAAFSGPIADSPTNYPVAGSNAPLSYIAKERPFIVENQTVSLVGDVTTNMTAVNDHLWEVVATNPVGSVSFRFQTVPTNSPTTTNLWGETAQPTSLVPFGGVADLGASAIAATFPASGRMAVRLSETGMAYTVRRALFQDFDAWPGSTAFGNYTNANWLVKAGSVTNDSTRKLRNAGLVLESNTTAWVRSPWLEEGIGEISFWYRNWQTNGSPATRCIIEKSKTGGEPTNEWVTVATVADIVGTGYNRYIVTVGDRLYGYVRIRNASAPSARLMIDEFMVTYPGAGVTITNVAHSPTLPAASNSVTIAGDIIPRADATNIAATLYYRTGTTGAWSAISMTPSAGTGFVTSSPIPPGRGSGNGGAGLVQYYIVSTFTGFESEAASPVYYPEWGSNSPASFIIQPAMVTMTNAITIPTPPRTLAPVNLAFDLTPLYGASSIVATAYYRLGASGGYTALPMAASGGNTYTTTSPIPSPTQPGQMLYYYFTAAFTGPSAVTPTNYPVGGASAPITAIIRAAELTTSYTGMTVAGGMTADMALATNREWRAVATVTNLASPSFYFRGAASNIVTWGDSNPAVDSLPVYGTAEVSAASIPITGNLTGPHVFRFNEHTLAYNVQRCAYVNFDGWVADAYSSYTNADGWAISDGRVTDSQPDDAAHVWKGNSLVLKNNPGTNQYIRSPELTNGIGEISFYYRNWETNGALAGSFSVQVAAGTNATWITVGTMSNILTMDYLFYSVTLSDRSNRYVRILNSQAGTHPRLCIDELTVSDPGAGVVFSDLVHTPAEPTVMDAVQVYVNASPRTGATNLVLTAWYRAGTSGWFEPTEMSEIGPGAYKTVTGIPQGPVGPMQYYVSCAYDGFGAEDSSPVYFPPGGSNSPAVYTNADTGLFQDFESWSFAGVPTSYSENGWYASDASIRANLTATSGTNAIWLAGFTTYTNSYVQSPLITNLFGEVVVTFNAKSRAIDVIEFEVQVSYNPFYWEPVQIISLTNRSQSVWTPYVVTLTNDQFYVRIFKSQITAANQFLGIDDLEIAQQSTRIKFSDVMIDPGYPASNDLVYVSCDIETLTPGMPAFDILGALYYKLPGGPSFIGPVTMARAGKSYRSTTGIPVADWKSTVNYYIRSDFEGYYHRPSLNRSPMYFPEGGASTPSNYIPRLAKSEYSVLTADSQSGLLFMDQLSDYTWQGALDIEPTNRIEYVVDGYGRYTGTNYTSNVWSWGDSAQWKTNLPLWSNGEEFGNEIVAQGDFAGQYLFRFNENTREYSLIKADAQDFEEWGTSDKYITSGSADTESYRTGFETGEGWQTNDTRRRWESFDKGAPDTWTSVTKFTNQPTFLGSDGWGIYQCRIMYPPTSRRGTYSAMTTSNQNEGIVVHPQQELEPMRGIGTVSFWYRALNTNVYDIPVGVGLYLCKTNEDYTSLLRRVNPYYTNGNIRDVAWSNVVVTINTNETLTVIVAHNEGNEAVLFDDLQFTEWYADSAASSNGWTAVEKWIVAGMQRSGTNCLEFDRTRAEGDQYIVSPRMTNGVGFFDFWYRSVDGRPISFVVQVAPGSDTSTWQTVDAKTNSSTSYLQYSGVIMTNADCYVRLLHTSNARMLVDDIRITGIPTLDNWKANNARVVEETTRNFRGTACYLNKNASTDVGYPCDTTTWPYIRSPYMAGGIGEVSFWYRNWDTGTPNPATLRLQRSETGGDGESEWTDFATLPSIVNRHYMYYRTAIYDASNKYVRIINATNISSLARVCLDEIVITSPIAADIVLRPPRTEPVAPVSTDSVYVVVDAADPFLSPSNVYLYTEYSTGPSYGSWPSTNTFGMQLVSSNVAARIYTYRSVMPIPPQAADTFVRYAVRAEFEGLNASFVTPKYGRTFQTPSWYYPLDYGTSTPYYIVLSCATNAVWINEVDARQSTPSGHTKDMVEIAGLAGSDISGWRFDIVTAALATQGLYTVPASTTLPFATNGFGFYVLAKSTVTPRDLTLTNSFPYGGGIALRRPPGMYASAVCFGALADIIVLTNSGFVYIGSDQPYSSTKSLSAVGTGGTFSAFTWTDAATATPGALNIGQELEGGSGPLNEPPDCWIVDVWVDSNVWITCTGTNGWAPAPLYATNLLATNPAGNVAWASVPVFWTTYPTLDAGSYTVWFAKMTNSPTYFYAITNSVP